MALFGFGKKEEKKPAAKIVDTAPKSSPISNRAVGVLRRPMITEKAIGSEDKGWYVFKVSAAATKSEAKKEVERLFNVKVEKVNSVKVKARPSLFKGKVGYHGGFKKMMIKLAPGQKIEIISR